MDKNQKIEELSARIKAELAELSDEELDKVAGGSEYTEMLFKRQLERICEQIDYPKDKPRDCASVDRFCVETIESIENRTYEEEGKYLWCQLLPCRIKI